MEKGLRKMGAYWSSAYIDDLLGEAVEVRLVLIYGDVRTWFLIIVSELPQRLAIMPWCSLSSVIF